MFGTIDQFSFRDLHHHLLVISNDPKHVTPIVDILPHAQGDNAVLAYGYIDHTAGITFEVLCAASMVGTKVTAYREPRTDTSFKLRYDAVKGLLLSVEDSSLIEKFADTISRINENYKAPKVVEEMRRIWMLDRWRDAQFPDDIQVFFIGAKQEVIWGRPAGYDGQNMTVTLLNEPWADFGVHLGDIVPIRLVSVGREFAAIALLPEGYGA